MFVFIEHAYFIDILERKLSGRYVTCKVYAGEENKLLLRCKYFVEVNIFVSISKRNNNFLKVLIIQCLVCLVIF